MVPVPRITEDRDRYGKVARFRSFQAVNLNRRARNHNRRSPRNAPRVFGRQHNGSRVRRSREHARNQCDTLPD